MLQIAYQDFLTVENVRTLHFMLMIYSSSFGFAALHTGINYIVFCF